ncbi:complement receptor type 2 isoform X2 [Eurytemora carolleeae]|uniref:complement receptor type 2 isoform X2 n=1 Tax=Eurytemora carolleeae TaxID=1294199 RepID=UPI000C793435|nr:complement receptor type 2 isoform X2 [Eurytemora carolleeae]|eukprot:XP_023325982.1 complement receptor type 2-like isoform X2 [Eurytemora affinis]
MGLYDYRPYVKRISNDRQIMFDCNKEFRIDEGPRGATCIDGRWSPSHIPVCLPDNHPNIRWLNKREVEKSDVAEILQELSAGLNQGWSNDKKKRVKRSLIRRRREAKDGDCSQLENDLLSLELVKAGKEGPEYYRNGANVKVSCKPGYTLKISKFKYRCRKGEWKPEEPVCQLEFCLVPRIENGLVRKEDQAEDGEGVELGEGNHVQGGEDVYVSCNPGYKLRGPSSMQCGGGGGGVGWNIPRFPSCEPEPCSLPSIEHGYYSHPHLSSPDSLLEGESISYSCLPGYQRSNTELTCMDGLLLPGQPECWLGSPSSLPALEPSIPAHQLPVYPVHQNFVNPKLKEKSFCAPPTDLNGELSFLNSHLHHGAKSPTPHKPGANSPTLQKPGTISPAPDKPGSSSSEPVNPSSINSITSTTPIPKVLDPEPIVGASTSNIPLSVYPPETVMDFGCILTSKSSKISWKIRCREGEWRGEYVPCDSAGNPLDDVTKIAMVNRTCSYVPATPNLVAFYKDLEVLSKLILEPGAVLVFRCTDIGKFKLVGERKLVCGGGELMGDIPTCNPLSQSFNYALDKPPTILFRHEQGPIAQTNTGELVVYPGTILHMECLFLKKFGSPSWTTRRVTRKVFPQGWAIDRMRDSTLEYRISIYHATPGDTGEYTCTTPAGQSTSVNIIVDNITCPFIPLSRYLMISSNETMLSTQVTFSCSNRKQLIGPSTLTCLSTGSWSSMPPACEKISCPSLNSVLKDIHVRAEVISNKSGGKVKFSCPSGFLLRGDLEAECSHTGTWIFIHQPQCHPIMCPPPTIPIHGELQTPGPFRVGDIARFVCKIGHIMKGSSFSACIGDGTWSDTPPSCTTACTYPGSSPGGFLDPVRFYYKVGETAEFFCNPGLVINGTKMIKCLDSGNWSGSFPSCTTK